MKGLYEFAYPSPHLIVLISTLFWALENWRTVPSPILLRLAPCVETLRAPQHAPAAMPLCPRTGRRKQTWQEGPTALRVRRDRQGACQFLSEVRAANRTKTIKEYPVDDALA
jgi:hypothetical protein